MALHRPAEWYGKVAPRSRESAGFRVARALALLPASPPLRAGFDPKVAELLGERDSNGYGPYPAIAAMLAASGTSGDAWNNFLASLKSEEDLVKFRKFAMLARQITASGNQADANRNALLKLGHKLFGDRFPAPEGLPGRP